MYILTIETTGPLGSVAIIDGDGRISMKASTEEMNHLKELMPMAASLTEQLHISKQELTAVAASIGPGSFTGIRIGVSSARAIAQALDIPCIAVPTLDSFRLKPGALVVPIFNARRGQVYGAIFAPEATAPGASENTAPGAPEKCLAPGPYMLTDVLQHLVNYANSPDYSGETIIFYGDGIDAYEQQISDTLRDCGVNYEFAPKEERYQTAAMTAEYALAEYKKGNLLKVNELLPDYMRVAEAEQKLRDGSLARERAAKMARFRSK